MLKFVSLEGEDEDDLRYTEAFIMAEGEVDVAFIERFERASETVRRMSVNHLTFDSILDDIKEEEKNKQNQSDNDNKSTNNVDV